MSDFLEIHALADGEASGDEKQAAELLLSQDSAARSEFQSLVALKQTLQKKLPTHDSSSVWRKSVERLAELEQATVAERFVGKYSYGMAAFLVFAILGAAYFNRASGGAMDAGRIAQTITASAADQPGFSIDSAERAFDWLRQKLGAKVSAPQTTPSLRLVSVSTVLLEGQKIGRFLYTDGSTNYVLLVAPNATPGEGGSEVPGYPGVYYYQCGKLNVISWVEGQTTFALAADKDRDSLLRLLR